MRVLIFGDSITQGYWDTKGGWVDRLRASYDERQVQDLQGRDEPTIFNLGISADDSRNILSRIESETTVRTRHSNLPVIIVQIGVNDSSTDHGSVRVPLDEYRQNLKAIIQKMTPLSSMIIFVGLSGVDESKTSPVFWGDYYYVNETIKSYEAVMQKVAQEHSIPFISIFDAFMTKVKAGADLLPDGLHPNNEGHQVIFEIVKPKLTELFGRGKPS